MLSKNGMQCKGLKTDIKCHFYYDESNNCRKFWVRTNQKKFRKKSLM